MTMSATGSPLGKDVASRRAVQDLGLRLGAHDLASRKSQQAERPPDFLFIDASMGVPEGLREGGAGVSGPNGAGKTTILRMIAGQSSPTTARVTI